MKSTKLAVIAIAAGAALVATTGIAYAAARAADANGGSALRSGAGASLVSAALDGTTQSGFTPVATCRVADTRGHGGPIASTATRDFFVGGTAGFTPQGGHNLGCGIPTTATSVSVIITMVGASANGFLHVWKQGTTEPSASYMNFAKSFNVSAGGNVITSGDGKITVKPLGAKSDVVIDVTGFYVAPLYAHVNSDGTIATGSRTTGSSRLSAGQYEIDFDRDVTNCAYAASVDPSTGYTLKVQPRSGVASGVFVRINDGTNNVDTLFYLTVTC